MEPDSELKQLLRQNLVVSQETNELLHKMHKAMKWARIIKVVYWLIILGIAGSLFYFLSDTYKDLIGMYKSLLQSGQGGGAESSQFQQFLKSFQ